jgi:hypothetical protein
MICRRYDNGVTVWIRRYFSISSLAVKDDLHSSRVIESKEQRE